MNTRDQLPLAETFAAKERRLDMQHLNAIEGNPLDAEQVAMFEMFDRERWSHEQCLAHVLERARKAGCKIAAE